MAKQKARNRKTNASVVYSILSTALVLYLLGLFAFLFLNAKLLSNHFKENLEISIILNDEVKDNELLALQANLNNKDFIKSIDYTSKEEAKAIFLETFNESFDDVLGYNPLHASLNIKLKADYANEDSIQKIINVIDKKAYVNEIYYQKNLVQLVNNNLKTFGYIILVVSTLFFLITLSLIDNTIKLSMYSQRFLIRSMQLVGATKSFVTRPFIKKSINNGILAGVLAVVMLTLTLLYFQYLLPEVHVLKDLVIYIITVLLIFFTGLFISWWSTKRAVKKYIVMKLDELY